MASNEKCADRVARLTGLSKREVGGILRELNRVKDRHGPNYREAVKRYIAERSDELNHTAKLQRQRAMLQAQSFEDASRFVDRFDKPIDGLKSFLVGSSKDADGNADSIYGAQQAEHVRVLRSMNRELNDHSPGLAKQMLRSRSLADDVARELGGTDTGNDLAKSAASIVEKYRESARTRANNAGADIAKRDNYIMAQSHDVYHLVKARYDKWRDFVLPRLDLDQTFGGDDPELFLKEVYRDIVSGMHERVDEMAHQGPANLAGKLSRKRVLHFKNPEAFIEYNANFGKGSVTQGLLNGIKRLNDSAVLMERMGPNPDAMFERLVTHYRKVARAADHPLTDSQIKGLENRFSVLTNKANTPVNVRAARFAQGVRNVQTLTSLGKAVLHSMPDLANATSIAHSNGVSFLSAYGALLEDTLKHFAPSVRQETIDHLDFAMESLQGDVMGRVNANSGVPGFLSSAVHHYFRLNFLEQWTDSVKGAATRLLASHLAANADKTLDELPGSLSKNLKGYGIDADLWDRIRETAPQHLGRRAVLAADDVADDVAAEALRRFYVGESEMSVLTPGARERAIILQGTQPGTPMGEAMRFLAMFHMYSLSTITKLWPRVYHDGVPSAINLAIMGAVLGYIGNTLSDLAEGKTPADPADPKVITRAIVTGGGAAFLGDLVFHNFNSYYGSLSSFIGGPAASGLNDLSAAFSAAGRGNEKQAGERLFNVMRYHAMPFANLFYTQAAVNYLFTYQMQNLINPGSLQRMESKQRKETGQHYFVPPSEVAQ